MENLAALFFGINILIFIRLKKIKTPKKSDLETIDCKNCNTQFEGNYCPNCSQSVEGNSRLEYKQIVTDFMDTVFNLDKGFFYTVWNLLKRPGFVAQSFIDGKRKMFTNPVKFFIIATAIQALIEYLFMYKEEGVPYTSFSFLSEGMNQNMHLWNEALTLDYPILAGVVNLLIWPLPLYFLFRKLDYNFTELIASMLYFYGTIVILIEAMVVFYIPIMKKNIPIAFVSLLGTCYMIYSFSSFFRKGSISWRIPRIIISLLCLFVFRMFLFSFLLAWLFPMV